MFEIGKIIFGVVSLILMYNILNINLPPFLETIKNNEDVIKIFSFYYVYDLTQNVYISFISVLLIELSRKYQKEVISSIKENSKNITITSYYLKDDINKNDSYDSQLKYRLKEYKFELFILNLLNLKNIFTNKEIHDIYSEMFREKLNAISQYSNITNVI